MNYFVMIRSKLSFHAYDLGYCKMIIMIINIFIEYINNQ